MMMAVAVNSDDELELDRFINSLNNTTTAANCANDAEIGCSRSAQNTTQDKELELEEVVQVEVPPPHQHNGLSPPTTTAAVQSAGNVEQTPSTNQQAPAPSPGNNNQLALGQTSRCCFSRSTYTYQISFKIPQRLKNLLITRRELVRLKKMKKRQQQQRQHQRQRLSGEKGKKKLKKERPRPRHRHGALSELSKKVSKVKPQRPQTKTSSSSSSTSSSHSSRRRRSTPRQQQKAKKKPIPDAAAAADDDDDPSSKTQPHPRRRSKKSAAAAAVDHEFFCKICEASFASAYHLNRHFKSQKHKMKEELLITHSSAATATVAATATAGNQCIHCQKSFSNKASLNMHMKKLHYAEIESEAEEARIAAPKSASASARVSSSSSNSNNMTVVAGTEPEPEQAEEQRDILRRDGASTEFEFGCQVCGIQYKSGDSLAAHLLSEGHRNALYNVIDDSQNSSDSGEEEVEEEEEEAEGEDADVVDLEEEEPFDDDDDGDGDGDDNRGEDQQNELVEEEEADSDNEVEVVEVGSDSDSASASSSGSENWTPGRSKLRQSKKVSKSPAAVAAASKDDRPATPADHKCETCNTNYTSKHHLLRHQTTQSHKLNFAKEQAEGMSGKVSVSAADKVAASHRHAATASRGRNDSRSPEPEKTYRNKSKKASKSNSSGAAAAAGGTQKKLHLHCTTCNKSYTELSHFRRHKKSVTHRKLVRKEEKMARQRQRQPAAATATARTAAEPEPSRPSLKRTERRQKSDHDEDDEPLSSRLSKRKKVRASTESTVTSAASNGAATDSDSDITDEDGAAAGASSSTLACKICNITCTRKSNLTNHLNSGGHQKRAAAEARLATRTRASDKAKGTPVSDSEEEEHPVSRRARTSRSAKQVGSLDLDLRSSDSDEGSEGSDAGAGSGQSAQSDTRPKRSGGRSQLGKNGQASSSSSSRMIAAGNGNVYHCKTCQTSYRNKSHLTRHHETRMHKQAFALQEGGGKSSWMKGQVDGDSSDMDDY